MSSPAGRPEVELFTVGGQHVVHVPAGRGDDLRRHLASCGIPALVSPAAEAIFERVEIDGDVDVAEVRAAVDGWPR
jgi:hypothetical protein